MAFARKLLTSSLCAALMLSAFACASEEPDEPQPEDDAGGGSGQLNGSSSSGQAHTSSSSSGTAGASSSGGTSSSGGSSSGEPGSSSSGGSSSGEPGSSSSGGSSSGEPGSSSSGGSSSGEPGSSSSGGSSSGAPPDPEPAPALGWRGRWDLTTPTQPVGSWPGTRLVARFRGPAMKITLSQSGSTEGTAHYDVLLDGAAHGKLTVQAGQAEYDVVQGLADAEHLVELVRRTEPQQGRTQFLQITFPGGQLLAAPPERARRLQVLTESSMDGYGIESADPGGPLQYCTNNGNNRPMFHNARRSFPQKLADAFDAELELLGISNVGVSRGGVGVFSTYYGAAAPTPNQAGPAWQGAGHPDAIVFGVGGADFDGDGNLPADMNAKYLGLVDAVRAQHPDAHLFLAVGPQQKDYDAGGGVQVRVRTRLSAVLDAVKAARPGDARLHKLVLPQNNDGSLETACSWHASEPLHTVMFNAARPVIAEKLGW